MQEIEGMLKGIIIPEVFWALAFLGFLWLVVSVAIFAKGFLIGKRNETLLGLELAAGASFYLVVLLLFAE